MIQEWLAICMTSHAACKIKALRSPHSPSGDIVALPTRVIDVGLGDGSQEPLLLETKGLNGLYFTLSHCWGTGRVTRTTMATLEAHKRAIPMAGLSPNFRDAILVTRRLGARYLWIDSLCIIQDSHTDWESESSRMAQIYNHSALTLSAAKARCADEGFLKARIPLEDRSVRVPYRDPTNGSTGWFYLCPPLRDFDTEFGRSHLSGRGWTLQERTLSRRNVSFGEDQLHWECQTLKWSESTRFLEVDISSGLSSIGSLNSIGSSSQAGILKTWYSLVGEFSRRMLTKGDDKLPALSGLANVVCRALCGREGMERESYLAGIWKQDLIRGLLWKSFGPTKADQVKVRPPSWSWVSHAGRIDYGHELKAAPDITGAEVSITAGLDPFGQVKYGMLTVRGCIKAVPSVVRTGPDYQDINGEQPYLYTNAILKNDNDQEVGGGYLDSPNAALDETIYCLPLCHEEVGAPARVSKIHALLVCRVPDDTDIYQRVGVGELGPMGSGDRSANAPFMVFFRSAQEKRIRIV